MNVPVEQLVALAQALGVSKDLKADGVVRTAIERLKGEREYHLECRQRNSDAPWNFISFYPNFPEAQAVRAAKRAEFPGSDYRIVEMLRRVLP